MTLNYKCHHMQLHAHLLDCRTKACVREDIIIPFVLRIRVFVREEVSYNKLTRVVPRQTKTIINSFNARASETTINEYLLCQRARVHNDEKLWLAAPTGKCPRRR